jgi:hypothetical protein
MFHLIRRPVLESREDDHEVRLGQFLDAGHVIGSGLDLTFGVYAEDDRAFEPMVFGQDTGKGRQGLLGAVFVIACYENEVSAFADTFIAFVDERSCGVKELE